MYMCITLHKLDDVPISVLIAAGYRNGPEVLTNKNTPTTFLHQSSIRETFLVLFFKVREQSLIPWIVSHSLHTSAYRSLWISRTET